MLMNTNKEAAKKPIALTNRKLTESKSTQLFQNRSVKAGPIEHSHFSYPKIRRSRFLRFLYNIIFVDRRISQLKNSEMLGRDIIISRLL